MLTTEVLITDRRRFIDDHFGKVCQRLGKARRRDTRFKQVFNIDQEHLFVLESIEDSLLFFECRGLIQKLLELPPKGVFGRLQLCFGEVFQNREEVCEVNAQKVVPEKVARAEQMSQHIHPFPFGQKGDDSVGELILGDLVDLIQKLIEMAHCFCRVWRLGQKSCELLDHGDRHPQPFLLTAVFDLAAPTIGYEKLVHHLIPAAFDFHFVDVNTSHRKRVRDGVQESEGVL